MIRDYFKITQQAKQASHFSKAHTMCMSAIMNGLFLQDKNKQTKQNNTNKKIAEDFWAYFFEMGIQKHASHWALDDEISIYSTYNDTTSIIQCISVPQVQTIHLRPACAIYWWIACKTARNHAYSTMFLYLQFKLEVHALVCFNSEVRTPFLYFSPWYPSRSY